MIEATKLEPGQAPRVVLREWSVTHAYSSYYLEPINDLDLAAAALVRSGVASVAYVADGAAYWTRGAELKTGLPQLQMREHETHANIKMPEGIDGWAAQGLVKALFHRFSEKKVITPLPAPHHEYLRAAMEPSVLRFGEDEVTVVPSLKLYRTGVFVVSYEVFGSEDAMSIPELVDRQLNLFARWCDEAWVPAAIARIGAVTSIMDDDGDETREVRAANVGLAVLMRAAAADASEPITVGEYEFSMYPAHTSLDDFFNRIALGEAQASTKNPGSAASSPAAAAVDGSQPAQVAATSPPAAAPDTSTEVVGDGASADAKEDEPPSQSYMLSDMFHNAEFAIRVTLDPPVDGKNYVRRGQKAPLLRRGNYWQCRPQVSIRTFDGQPATATEVREQFGDQFGHIMLRVRNAPRGVAREHLGASLRPFEDHTLHINEGVSLCVYASREGVDTSRVQPSPEILEPMERACTFEVIDYLAMRCRQLDERATLATSVAEARAVRTDVGAVENLARTSFRAGELNTAALAGWQQLRLPTMVQETREKISLAAEAATERSGEQASRLNLALTLVFGIVGTAGLTDAFTKPLWTKIGLPLPAGLDGPLLFAISAGFVLGLLWLVTAFLRKR